MVSSKEKVWLRPWNLIKVDGRLAYNEGFQAWNTIRLKQQIIAEFPQLKEKRTPFFYNINFVKTYNDLIGLVNKLKKEKKPIPLLLWFYKIDN